MPSLAWDDVRFFLSVSRAGSLARAARTLGVDQTTVGRRLAALEESLGRKLFERAPQGLSPTEAGRRVLSAAETMADAAGDFELAARSEERASETVRVATTDTIATHFLVPAVRALRISAPNVDVTVLTAWATANLLRGEADVAVRLVRPVHPRLVVRKVADFALRAYASRSYVAAHGAPRDDLRAHALLAYTDALAASSQLTLAGLDASDGRVVLRSNNGNALLRAAREGVGVAELPSYVGDADRALVRVCGDHERRYSIYLVTHQDRRHVPSVRAVCDAIVEVFRARPESARVKR